MARLLAGKPCVLSSGGGAFLSETTRALAKESALSIWIKVDTEVISSRTQGRTHRPLVPSADNQEIVQKFFQKSAPFFAEADLTVDSFDEHPSKTVIRLLKELESLKIITPYHPKRF